MAVVGRFSLSLVVVAMVSPPLSLVDMLAVVGRLSLSLVDKVAMVSPPLSLVDMLAVVGRPSLSLVDKVAMAAPPLSLAIGAGCGRGVDLRLPRLPPRGPASLAMPPWLVWPLGPPPLPLPPPLLPPPAPRVQRKGAGLCSSPSGLRMM